VEEGSAAFLFRARGCDRCDRGYRGQIAVHQLMLVDGRLRRLALAAASHEELSAAAFASGMRTLWEDGLAKALAGLTSVDELHAMLPG
jgi:general secretion pathway protein E